MSETRKQSEGFPKRVRLLRSCEFREVFDHKQSASDHVLIVYGRRQELTHARIGLVVSRKIGNAVMRNRWKRFIREVFRKQLATFPSGIDIVILPRRGAKPSFAAIDRSLPKLVRQLWRRLGKDDLR